MDDLNKKITDRLEELRIHLQADGGDLEIIGIDGKVVQLRLQGACGCCPHATMTITNVREPRAYFSGTPGLDPAAAWDCSAMGPYTSRLLFAGSVENTVSEKTRMRSTSTAFT